MFYTLYCYLAATALFLSFFQAVQAVKGVDVSSLTSQADFACLKNQGYTRVVLRAYIEAWGNRPGGKVDPNVVQNYRNAKAAGIPQVDLYMFPCTGRSTCKAPSQQVSEVINVMNSNHMSIGTIWFDVEVDPQSNNWPNVEANRRALTDYKNLWNSRRLNWGVYTSASQWSRITGSASWILDPNRPLWYAHYDGKASFSDFRPFGGWTRPTAKQYAGSTKLCNANVDLNLFA